jgi:hypothetical protein
VNHNPTCIQQHRNIYFYIFQTRLYHDHSLFSIPRTSCVCDAATRLGRRAYHDVIKTRIAAVPLEHLECLDLGEEVASELTDIGLKHILQSIDAVNKLKRLKLTHCFKIVGHGLKPLQNPRVIEQIDLSLAARNEDPSEGPDGLLSIEAVVHVLNRIIGTDVVQQCSIRHIQLPNEWTVNHVEELLPILSLYNRTGIACNKCNEIEYSRGLDRYQGTCYSQHRTCYECMDHYCGTCYSRSIIIDPFVRRPDHILVDVCHFCEEAKCQSCDVLRKCDGCRNLFCSGCREFVCCEECYSCKNCICQCQFCGLEIGWVQYLYL